MKRFIIALSFSLLSLLAITLPVMAYSYYALLSVVESGGTAYTMIPVICDIDNTNLAADGYIAADGLDTLVTIAGSTKPHMVVDDKVIFASAITANSSASVHYEMGNAPITNCHIVVGYGGYITSYDDSHGADGLTEPGNNFEVEVSGYFDTSAGADKNILIKDEVLRLYVSGANEITGVINPAVTPSYYATTTDGYVYYAHANYVTCQGASDGTPMGSDDPVIGQKLGFTIYRGCLYLDTTAIPDTITINTATLYVYGKTDNSTTDFNLLLYTGDAGHPSTPIVAGDYGAATGGVSASSTFNTSGFITTGYNAITLNAAGIAHINKTGVTDFYLLSQEDINVSQPFGDEYVTIYGGNTAGTDHDPYIVISYAAGTTKTVTGAGITTAEHTIILTADGTDLKLFDGVTEKDSEALAGASVADNTNNWVWIQNNVCPYLDYIKYSKPQATLIAHYQPNDIIATTVMPDREGAAQNGVITFGTNPAGLAATAVKLVGGSAVTITNPTITVPGVPAPGAGSMVGTSGIASSPLYAFFTALEDISTVGGHIAIPAEIWGLITCFMITGGLILMTARVIKGGLILPIIAGGIGIGIGYALEFYKDLWIPLAYVVISLAMLLQANRQGQGV